MPRGPPPSIGISGSSRVMLMRRGCYTDSPTAHVQRHFRAHGVHQAAEQGPDAGALATPYGLRWAGSRAHCATLSIMRRERVLQDVTIGLEDPIPLSPPPSAQRARLSRWPRRTLRLPCATPNSTRHSDHGDLVEARAKSAACARAVGRRVRTGRGRRKYSGPPRCARPPAEVHRYL